MPPSSHETPGVAMASPKIALLKRSVGLRLSTSSLALASSSRPLAAIISAGLLCGLMDITAAFITWWPKGVKPPPLLQGIAAGWLGPNSFNGGMATAALGLAFHFLIAFTAAFVFYVASRHF